MKSTLLLWATDDKSLSFSLVANSNFCFDALSDIIQCYFLLYVLFLTLTGSISIIFFLSCPIGVYSILVFDLEFNLLHKFLGPRHKEVITSHLNPTLTVYVFPWEVSSSFPVISVFSEIRFSWAIAKILEHQFSCLWHKKMLPSVLILGEGNNLKSVK